MSTFGPPNSPTPGYYPDPTTGVSRWWDGQAWGGNAPPQNIAVHPSHVGTTAHGVGTSGYAIASLVLGLCWIYGIGSILAVIFGHIGRKQCDRA
jgi:hypothetical protein